MRTYSERSTLEVRQLLHRLTESSVITPPLEYRETMRRLGIAWTECFPEAFLGLERLLLVCTNEDADFLARGILQGLKTAGGPHVSLACFWNNRASVPGSAGSRVEIAPIIRRYVEPNQSEAFLVVKSIISSACVVRTNITELVYEYNPSRILVFAPVVLQGAEDRLKQEFDEAIADRFEFFWFALDTDKKDDGEVVPGIGGSVYERLGVGSSTEKNRYIPELVKERRHVEV